jgi:hypothetical protein
MPDELMTVVSYINPPSHMLQARIESQRMIRASCSRTTNANHPPQVDVATLSSTLLFTDHRRKSDQSNCRSATIPQTLRIEVARVKMMTINDEGTS